MKARESGMPDKDYWSTFFAAEAAIDRLFGGGRADGDVVDFGCGYGTFTFPVARRTTGVVTALDIEPEMVALVRQNAADQGILNVRAYVRDFVADGTGLSVGSQSHAMIYNLLRSDIPSHCCRRRTGCFGPAERSPSFIGAATSAPLAGRPSTSAPRLGNAGRG